VQLLSNAYFEVDSWYARTAILDVALAAATRRALEEISEALGRLDYATFGLCAGCGKLIPFERLKAWPRARCCVHCE
jgi:RNA polymerase-binding transcription factor DksA